MKSPIISTGTESLEIFRVETPSARAGELTRDDVKMLGIVRRAALLLPLLLAACSDAGSSTRRELQIAQSSAASSVMIIDAWLKGAAPDAYARRALDAARATLARAAGNLASEDSPQAENTARIDILGKLRSALRRASSAIAASDRDAMSRSRGELASAAQSLGALGNAGGA